jgi:hypothetical protein
MKSIVFAGLFASVALVSAVRADDGPRRPPQAAFDACKSKSAGDGCEVTFHDHTMSGTCAATPEGTLACRPDHPPDPPPEMTAACQGKVDGDACVVNHHGQNEDGVCRKGKSGALVCLP